MKSLYQKLVNKPITFKQMTGLSPEQFNELAQRAEPVWTQKEKCRLMAHKRVRAIGAGHPYHLRTTKDKLFLVLVFYRLYSPYWLLGLLFGLDVSNTGRMIQRFSPLIRYVADTHLNTSLRTIFKKIEKMKEESRKRGKIRSVEELLKHFPEMAEIIHDATEQRIRKPSHKKKRYTHHSGKARAYTRKTQITTNQGGYILDVAPSVGGRMHDKRLMILSKVQDRIPDEIIQYLDRGYQKLDKEYPDKSIKLPHKRTRHIKDLDMKQKRYNKQHSRHRIHVEHVFASLKKNQILSQPYRHNTNDYDTHFRNIAAIHNFKLSTTHSQYAMA